MKKTKMNMKALCLVGALLVGGVVPTTIKATEYESNAGVSVASVKKTQYGTVTASSLNMRSSASTKGKVVTKLKKNTKVTIVKKQSNGWYKVKYRSKIGFVSGSYLKITNQTTSNTNKDNNKTNNNTINNNTNKNDKVTGMDFLEFKKKRSSFGFDETGGYADGEPAFYTGVLTADENGAYFGLEGGYHRNNRFPNWQSTLKNCFNLLLPTKGDELYKIVSKKNVKNQTLYMNGRKVTIEKDSYDPDYLSVYIEKK